MPQAQATQEANRAASNRWPPFWAILAMLVLGWNEFLAVLYNPLWLLAALLVFLFGKTVYEARPSPRAQLPPTCLMLQAKGMHAHACRAGVHYCCTPLASRGIMHLQSGASPLSEPGAAATTTTRMQMIAR